MTSYHIQAMMVVGTMLHVMKWVLIFMTIISNNTLAWKIWTRKNLHTVFNLGLCFFFLWCSIVTPLLLYEYGTFLDKMLHVDEPVSPICNKLILLKTINMQIMKVFSINFLFR